MAHLPGNDEGGIVMLSHPANYNHPEPLTNLG